MLETCQLFRDMAIGNTALRTLTDEDIRDVQEVLLSMLQDIDAACRKYHLVYFLGGGTALGAVRHKGFIPWDEDIDLIMPRKDYDRLARVLKKEYAGKYWVQDIRGNAKYDLNFMKVRKSGTRYQEIFESDCAHAGIFIDIFPLEDTYDSALLRLLQGGVGELLLLISSCVRIYSKKELLLQYTGEKKGRRLVQLKAFLGRLFSFFPLRKWLLITEGWLALCRNRTSRYVSIPSGRKHYFGELYTRASFFPPRKVEFEKQHFFIMNNPDEYLSKMYGDYMQIPPKEKRERHSVVELDTGK